MREPWVSSIRGPWGANIVVRLRAYLRLSIDTLGRSVIALHSDTLS